MKLISNLTINISFSTLCGSAMTLYGVNFSNFYIYLLFFFIFLFSLNKKWREEKHTVNRFLMTCHKVFWQVHINTNFPERIVYSWDTLTGFSTMSFINFRFLNMLTLNFYDVFITRFYGFFFRLMSILVHMDFREV